jgi:putative transposase
VTITTDGASGLTKAIDAMWPKSLRSRCGCHKMQNLQQKVPAHLWPEVKAVLGDMREAPTREKAEKRREAIVAQYQRELPEACRCLLDDAQASLNHLLVPHCHHQYGRTSTLVERAFVEERRRTKVIPPFWGEPSLVNRVFGVLIWLSDRWARSVLVSWSNTGFAACAGSSSWTNRK